VPNKRPATRSVKPTGKSTPVGAEDSAVEDLTVHADADKLFFIDMLVKDIELVPAVLDLVDNSVDSARAQVLAEQAGQQAGAEEKLEDGAVVVGRDSLPAAAYAGKAISVVALSEAFEIIDNCGGIDLTTARNKAFRFGRGEGYTGVPGSVGEFGVGMKRALFKLGRAFQVMSRTETTSFFLDVDVDDWAKEEGPWTFRLQEAKSGLSAPEDGWTGTKVRVTRLHDTVRQDFKNPLVTGQLREQLRLRHQGAIKEEMAISLNDETLDPFLPALLSGTKFQPLNKSYTLQQPDGQVYVRIAAGIVAPPRQRETFIDEGRAENFTDTGDAGWWVFCNDRLLLMRDRSRETGWGNGAAAYHPQYRLFRGYVFLTAANTKLLPWNTTKTGVDQDSRVWRQVQSDLKIALAEIQSVINRLKAEREDSTDTSDPDQAPFTHALANTTSTPLNKLEPRDTVLAPPPKRRRRRSNLKKIQYSVEVPRFIEVANDLGTANASEIGRQTFDYFYDREI
jgi:hypothetical protein